MVRRRSVLLGMASITALMGLQIDALMAAERRGLVGDKPILITGDNEDPRFNQPYIEIEEWRDAPAEAPNPLGLTTQRQDTAALKARHYYVQGGFKGTDAKFTFCFPPPEQYQERFYQPTHQLLTSPIPQPRTVAMTLDAGAYCVQTNMGGSEMARTAEDSVKPGYDAQAGSYRVNAAAAKYSRVVAQRVYARQHRPFGYLYGGSGGAYQVVAGAQNTKGVWDGFIPYVMGDPRIDPGQFLVRAHALRVLKNKWPSIIDAFEPGGGDPYAGLNAEERLTLEEATLYGFPPRAWFNYVPQGTGPMGFVAAYVPLLDPTYTTDFWTKPGYIVPPSTARDVRVQETAKIVRVIQGPPSPTRSQFMVSTQLELSNVPTADLTNAALIGVTGDAAGQSAPLGTVNGNTVSFALGANPIVVGRFKPGDTIRFDNSLYLSLQTWYRHGMPERGTVWDFPAVFDSFRKADGSPKYPQREIVVGLRPGFGDEGVTPGAVHGKVIVLQSMMDGDALPWEGAWYAQRVREALGAKFDDNFRIWYSDFAQHTPPTTPLQQTHVISYQGELDQALRDLSAWTEKGVAPPASTNYRVVKGQVEVLPDAASRKGVQPVVNLRANSAVRAEVAAGQPVTFSAQIDVPPSAGSVVAADWDFEGAGTYADTAQLSNTSSSSVTVTASHTYTRLGTYFAAIRATSHRQGDATTPYGRVQNLGRVRVVVT